LEASGQLPKVLNPKGVKTGALLDDNALHQRSSRREQFAFRDYLADIILLKAALR